MKTKILFLLAAVAISVSAFSQRPTLEIHFTAKHQDQHVPLDSIFIKNLTQGGQTMLYYPDTTLVLDYVLGIANAAKQEQNKFTVLQNIPNPFSGKTNFDVIIPEKESVQIVVSDIVGKVTAFFSDELRQGKHTFCYKAGPQKFYLLTLSGKSGTKTIKMLNTGVRADHAGIGRIEYVGWNELPVMPISKSGKDFEYNLGDQLRFTGFATTMSGIAGNDIIVDNPISGETYEFNISEGIPCPYSPLVEYEGQVYHTILIGTQCWIKENMNVGTKLLAGQSQANNGIIEKYCYLNDESNCDLYGGLYQWDEMMQYSTQEGAKGICPQIGDWHIPTDDDWKTLEGRVDNQYHIGNSIWNITGWRGSDIGTRLKSTRGWDNGGNGTDNFGFTALAGGFYNLSNSFESMDSIANFWASSSYNTTNPWMRGLSEGKSTAFRHFFYAQDYGFSVRCVRFTAVNLPVVTTQPVSNISQYSATSGGTVTSAGNSPVIERGVCWSLMPNPTLENDHTADGSGSGTFESQLSDLFLNSHYYVRAYATNSEGTSYGEQVEFNTMPSPPCPGMETVVYGDKEYNTLMIGTLCWMKENLDIGDMIPGDEEQINNGVIEKYCYINDPAYCETYGGLYQWGEAMQYFTQPGATGICPGGWHIPTHEDWKMLEGTVDSLYPPDDPEWEEIGFRGYDVGKRLKSSYGWFQSNGNDLYSFTMLPAGWRASYGQWEKLLQIASFWTSRQYDPLNAWTRFFIYNSNQSYNDFGSSDYGFSVRCVRELSGTNLPVVTTSYLSVVSQTEASCGGNVWADGGFPVTARGVCWDTLPNPTIAGNHSTNGTGTGVFSSQITGLTTSTTYYLRAYATNSQGTAYGDSLTFTTLNGQPCPGSQTVSHGGRLYHTVLIANQCWLKENLNIGTMIPGDEHMEDNGIIEKYCYDNYPENCENDGGLYEWYEMMQYNVMSGSQGICPDGWHTPSLMELNVLFGTVDSQYDIRYFDTAAYYSYIGFDAGKNLKTTSGWYNNGNGTDVFGFSAIPAGYQYSDPGWNDHFNRISQEAWFWLGNGVGNYFFIDHPQDGVFRGINSGDVGYSVRCIRNLPSLTIYTMPGEIHYTSAIIHGHVSAEVSYPITQKGICWSTEKYPTIDDPHTNEGGGTGIFDSQMYDLQPNITYYVRGYATNSHGTGYSNQEEITTLNGSPCPGGEYINYDDQLYHTVLIGNQCWMRENLNIGMCIVGSNEQTDNGMIEKYCYNDEPSNCNIYGGLYQWNEAMQYVTSPGAQGICPAGWHIPTDEEWKILEGTVDSQYPVGDPEWDLVDYRGYDAGKNLKSIEGWGNNGNGTNLFGFTSLPGGYCADGWYSQLGWYSQYWLGNLSTDWGMRRIINSDIDKVGRWANQTTLGFSVRCLKNN